MGKPKTPPSKADELREVTREANGVLGDLRRERREIEELIESGFEKRVGTCARRAEQTIATNVVKLANQLRAHADQSQKALMKRWAYIETACMADPGMGRLIALYVLQSAGPVETNGATWHLVKEMPNEGDGSPAFAFHKTLTKRVDVDPEMAAALEKAVAEHRPDVQPLKWSPDIVEGLNEL